MNSNVQRASFVIADFETIQLTRILSRVQTVPLSVKPEGSLVYYNSMPGFPFLSKINLVQKLISEARRPVLEVNPYIYRVPVRERYGSTLLPATREQHDQNCTQSH